MVIAVCGGEWMIRFKARAKQAEIAYLSGCCIEMWKVSLITQSCVIYRSKPLSQPNESMDASTCIHVVVTALCH